MEVLLGHFVTAAAWIITLQGADISGSHTHFVTYTLCKGTQTPPVYIKKKKKSKHCNLEQKKSGQSPVL